MAEPFNDAVLPAAKAERYAALAEEVAAVLEGERTFTARLATVAAMLAQAFEHYSTGTPWPAIFAWARFPVWIALFLLLADAVIGWMWRSDENLE